MTDGVRPVRPVAERDRREAQRREAERRAGSNSRELVPVGEVVDEPPHPARAAEATAPADPAAAFSAQLMGQTGQRKGLKGGPPVLNSARASYLGNEYSGENDRRPPSGLVRKTDV
ncbi:hypothetical protein [Brevundimonas subvibrioides]|uniref:hypothetical protein n=1 Tax=Brevundimonas subvibrioides TaxID=74313 RepID=UPI0022B50052|nr:hypothetical protein [Brevundimonas subvibrioides]